MQAPADRPAGVFESEPQTLLVAITIASLGMSAVAGPAAAAIDIGPIDPPDPGEIDIDVDPDVDTSGASAGAAAGADAGSSVDSGGSVDASADLGSESGSSSGGDQVVVPVSSGVASATNVGVQHVKDAGQQAADATGDAASDAAESVGEAEKIDAQAQANAASNVGEAAVDASNHEYADEAVAAGGAAACATGSCLAGGAAAVASQFVDGEDDIDEIDLDEDGDPNIEAPEGMGSSPDTDVAGDPVGDVNVDPDVNVDSIDVSPDIDIDISI